MGVHVDKRTFVKEKTMELWLEFSSMHNEFKRARKKDFLIQM